MFFYNEMYLLNSFLIPALTVIISGPIILFALKKHEGYISLKQSLLIVPISWLCVSILGAFPYIISESIPSFFDALFETVSGLTTTGASILNQIDTLPKTILFWRALTHWIGGMGIVVLTVAVFPLVGIGGNTLLAAEAPGPGLEKITPRITSTAKIFWLIYLALTIIEAEFLYLAGMSIFDSITHAFATMATGGFSTYNDSLIAASPSVQIIITVFMLLAGTNFALHFALITGNIATLWHDSEWRLYISFFIIATLLIVFNLAMSMKINIVEALRITSFQVASIITTTGFVAVNFEHWPYFAQTILLLLMFIGGSAGSTGGGIKVIRIFLVFKYALREITHFFILHKVQRIVINKKVVSEDFIRKILLFVTCYITLLLFTTLVVSFDNNDILTSFSTALATLGNIGPGFGNIGPVNNYAFFSPWVKAFLSFIMITGRLELFVVLIIFSPRFWK